MRKKLTTEEFIEKAKAVHGDTYDYSLVDYLDAKTKVIIICKVHGRFLQSPDSHINKISGCLKCANIYKPSTDEFIKKANVVHNNKYTYNNTIYNGAKTQVIITCLIHGDFEQAAHSHLQGSGCAQCNFDKLNKIIQLKSENCANSFVKKSNDIHNNFYTYTKCDYSKTNINVVITCPIHGDFEQTPRSHLSGSGCAKCKIDEAKSNTQEFINKASLKHNNKYTYANFVYVNSVTRSYITCLIHGDFTQTPSSHLQGGGCQSCAKGGFDSTKVGYLYYIKIITKHNELFYKPGITNKSNINIRIKQYGLIEGCTTKILDIRKYESGRECYEAEQEIHSHNKHLQYNCSHIMNNGFTETYNTDILGMDI